MKKENEEEKPEEKQAAPETKEAAPEESAENKVYNEANIQSAAAAALAGKWVS